MKGGRHVVASLALAAGFSLWGAPAKAFCGFYVSGADASLFNDATQVALMRDGTRTVLAMQNDYKGPPEEFALVVPVPVVLQKENVRTLPKEIFGRLDKLTAPRLVEYWERDPCGGIGLGEIGTLGGGLGTGQGFGAGHGRLGGADLGVKIEAQFEVGEYEILILSAKDSSGLDTWLRENKYKIPAGAADVLKPYVQGGSKFFVAKVDPKKVKFENGRAALSPLRFHYDNERLELPVKLGLLNSSGTQDLIVYVIGKDRYEVANFPNVTIPTNLDVTEKARAEFGAFYASLYDRTLEEHPASVVTEYAWQVTGCDPCPGDTSGMTAPDLMSLGADVIESFGVSGRTSAASVRMGATKVTGALPPEVIQRIVRQNFGRYRLCYENGLKTNPSLTGKVSVAFDIGPDGAVASAKDEGSDLPDKDVIACVVRGFSNLSFPAPENKQKVAVTYPITFSPGGASASPGVAATTRVPLVVTRLHARYGKGALGQDLVFRVAPAITGGREIWTDGALSRGAKPVTTDGRRGPGITSSFQARYAIRHAWTGPIACKEPQRGVWGEPPDASASPGTASATNLGLQGRGASLAAFTSLTGGGAPVATKLDAPGDAGAPASTTATLTDQDAGAARPPAPNRCGCRAVGATASTGPVGAVVLAALAVVARRRRRRPR